MKKIIIIILILILGLPAFTRTITGEIKKETTANTHRIYDVLNNKPVEGAKIKIPAKNYTTETDENGTFILGTKINSPTIMSIEKSGYKPESVTLKAQSSSPIVIGIEKTTPQDIILETDMIHLGDNSFSENSAHAGDFSIRSSGAFYSKDFSLRPLKETENIILKIGSIIGIDTLHAQKLGQSGVRTSYSSPPEIFCNGNKIAEIKINGDNQRINIPKAILRGSEILNITIKTGKNLYKTTSVDYDDIEFTNLLLEIK